MNTDQHWQLQIPLDAIVFDCDGTLSKLEGINTLAHENGVGEQVDALTEQAMGASGITRELFNGRMQLVKPSRQQLFSLGEKYFNDRADDVIEVLEALRFLRKPTFVVSAGLNPSVRLFAELLGVPTRRIYAVDVHFDEQGNFSGFDTEAYPAQPGGKRDVIKQIQKKYPRLMHIGDGMNDMKVKDIVARFVGFGGVYHRDSIADLCDFYIKSASLAPILPLSLTVDEFGRLDKQGREVYQKGLDIILNNEVKLPNHS